MNSNDSKKELLKEQYEDSLFAFLMDEYMESYGQSLIEENERLKKYHEYKLPEELEVSCLKTIEEVFQAKKRFELKNNVKMIFLKVSVFILFCGVAFVTLCSTVSAFREVVYKMIINDEGVSSVVSIVELGDVNVPKGTYLPTWLPQGYELIQYNCNDHRSVAKFKNKSGEIIKYLEYVYDVKISINTENAEIIEESLINGFEGLIVVKNENITVIWHDSKRKLQIIVEATNVEKCEALKIAESVKIN